VTFGNLRDKGTGYMAHSDRVGPGIVLLTGEPGLPDWATELADHLTDEGFTVLVPALEEMDDAARDRLLMAAASFLADNWHPRVGAIAFDDATVAAKTLAQAHPLDAIALYSKGAGVELGVEGTDPVPVVEHRVDDESLPEATELTVDFFRYNLS
jgi:hypothetical protein